jgi:V/A-type H+-transporting ATPase subunit I
MAISKIQKISIIGLENIKDKVLDYLQDTGLVEIVESSFKEKSLSLSFSDVEKRINSVISTLKFLHSLEPKKTLLLKEKNKLTLDEWQKIVDNYDYSKVIEEIENLKEKLEKFFQERTKLKEEYNLLFNYKNLDVSLDELFSLKDFSFFIGKIKKKEFLKFSKKINEIKTALFYKLSEDKNYVFLLVIFLKNDFFIIEKILKDFHFGREDLAFKTGLISKRLIEIKQNLSRIEKETEFLNKQLKNYLKEVPKLEVIFDYLYNLKEKILVEKNLTATQHTFILEGWIRKNDSLNLKHSLEKKFPVAVYLSIPQAKEDIPVVLENKPILRPFEIVTQLYGLPPYRGIDPTGFLSLFFVLSFALCLTDAGYGLILSLACLFILKKIKLSANAKRFFQLFFLSGIFTVIVGALAGGWFGNLLDKLPPYLVKIKNNLMLFDPLKEPLKFLGLVLVLGYIQITFGIFLKIISLIKERDFFGLFFNQIPTFLIQIVLFLLVLVSFKVLPKQIIHLMILFFVLAVILIIFYHFSAQKNFALKIFWSLYGIYSIITGNFLADTLSFSRLFALGLTTGLLATAINEIIFIIMNILSSLKISFLIAGFFAIILFVLGHLLNLAINLLGAYVHTSRLQYLEYFSKFFETGGRPFRPFRKEFVFTELIKNKDSTT